MSETKRAESCSQNERPLVSMPITTRHPEKWLAVDTETGEAWRWVDGRYVRAEGDGLQALVELNIGHAAVNEHGHRLFSAVLTPQGKAMPGGRYRLFLALPAKMTDAST